MPSPQERIWIVESDGRIMGCVAIVKFSREEAQLRWLLLHPDLRGRGLGRRLVEEAASFCRDGGYSSLFLWTVSTLPAAARLYRSICFHRFFVIKTILAGACLVHRILAFCLRLMERLCDLSFGHLKGYLCHFANREGL